MALGDDAIVPCFTLLTDVPREEIEEIQQKLSKGDNPMVFKKRLAFELTKEFNTAQAATAAQAEFERVFQQGQAPRESAVIFETRQREWNPVELLTATSLAASKSEAKRLIEQKSVEFHGSPIASHGSLIALNHGDIIKVGKKTFLKIHLLS